MKSGTCDLGTRSAMYKACKRAGNERGTVMNYKVVIVANGAILCSGSREQCEAFVKQYHCLGVKIVHGDVGRFT